VSCLTTLKNKHPKSIICKKDLFVTFSLERKSNQKVQGQPDRSARLSGQRTGPLR
jgi:hypothetical protein